MSVAISLLKKLKRAVLKHSNFMLQFIFRLMPIKNRVFFYSIRADSVLLENMNCVYDRLDAKKVVYTKTLPHSVFAKPKIYYYLLTSKVIVSDDYIRYLRFMKLRQSQSVIQLWHACGAFKHFGLDVAEPAYVQGEKLVHAQYSLVSVSAEQVRQVYANAFGVDNKIVQALGTPRTDILTNPNHIKELRTKLLERQPELLNKKIYLYCPTFREKDRKRVPFHPQINWEELNQSLTQDEVFVIKRHPAVKEDFLAGREYEKIIDLSQEMTSALIATASVLITDFSSVIFDASLLSLPMVLYAPDLETYERDFYLVFPEEIPAGVVAKTEELLEAIRYEYRNPPIEKITSFREKYMGACDGNATLRVVEKILECLK